MSASFNPCGATPSSKRTANSMAAMRLKYPESSAGCARGHGRRLSGNAQPLRGDARADRSNAGGTACRACASHLELRLDQGEHDDGTPSSRAGRGELDIVHARDARVANELELLLGELALDRLGELRRRLSVESETTWISSGSLISESARGRPERRPRRERRAAGAIVRAAELSSAITSTSSRKRSTTGPSVKAAASACSNSRAYLAASILGDADSSAAMSASSARPSRASDRAKARRRRPSGEPVGAVVRDVGALELIGRRARRQRLRELRDGAELRRSTVTRRRTNSTGASSSPSRRSSTKSGMSAGSSRSSAPRSFRSSTSRSTSRWMSISSPPSSEAAQADRSAAQAVRVSRAGRPFAESERHGQVVDLVGCREHASPFRLRQRRLAPSGEVVLVDRGRDCLGIARPGGVLRADVTFEIGKLARARRPGRPSQGARLCARPRRHPTPRRELAGASILSA